MYERREFKQIFLIITKVVLLIGIVFIVTGMIFNIFFFEKFVSYDNHLENSTKNIILFFEISIVITGIFFSILSFLMKRFSPRAKELIISLFFLCFTLLFFFAVTEIVVRFAFPTNELFSAAGTDPAIFQESTLIPWTLKPNATAHFVALDFDTEVTINSFGLRDKNRTLEKDNNVYRILIVGDSFTYGFGVNNNETYPAILEGLLNSLNSDNQFEVWNAGFASGYTEDTFYLYLRDIGLKFNPDVIIVGLFVENDILDFSRNEYIFNDTGDLVRITSGFYHVEYGKLRRGEAIEISTKKRMIYFLKQFLLRYSRAYSYFYNAVLTILTPENNPVFDKEYSEIINKNFNKSKYYLGQIKKLGDENNITVVVVLVPGKMSIDNLWQWYLRKNPQSLRDKPINIMLSYCQEVNITCLNLFPYFTNSTEEVYYFEHDAHWSKEGNQKNAEIIHQLLLSKNIINNR